MAGKALTLISITSIEEQCSDLDGLVEFAKSSQKESLLLIGDKRETVDTLSGGMDTSSERKGVHAGAESRSTVLLVGTGLGLMSLQ